MACVDVEDYAYLKQFRWRLMICSSAGLKYAERCLYISGDRIHILMHNAVMQRVLDRAIVKPEQVDHRDRDGLNNTRGNLRVATVSQNQCNKIKNNGSCLYKGVAKFHDRYRARIAKDGITYYLGVYDDQEEAAKAYDRAAQRIHGEFAVLNFPK